jgi:nicotinate phosphoribosyltransferase
MNTANGYVNALLTDLYQLTMAYAYWQAGKHNDNATFDLFFRKCPFYGEFAVFAGLGEVMRFLRTFRLTSDDIDYLRNGRHGMPPPLRGCSPAFFEWLSSIDCSQVRIHAIKEGTIVFPRIPLLRVEGPLAVCQLLETTLLNLVNYASLVATNATRFRLSAGKEKQLIEFGLRRAQGPDGAVSASHYSYIGGFNATSNVLAGKLFGIPVRGTHAHSFVSSYTHLGELAERTIEDAQGVTHDLVDMVLALREKLGFIHSNEGELAAFISYAQAFPAGYLALVDTYDTLKSGVPNFICVAAALMQLGYRPMGVRLDSGDLSYLSRATRRMFKEAGEALGLDLESLQIAASNDINEAILLSLNQQGHEIDVFGIGTHLVTCQTQPALGCVYKLVLVNDVPRIKLSQEVGKITIPGRKSVYRLLGSEGFPVLDLMIRDEEQPPSPCERILCRHPFDEAKRAYVTPSKVALLNDLVWNGGPTGPEPSIEEIRSWVLDQLGSFRQDHLRPLNPTPYKVSVSDSLYHFIHDLWMEEAPITEIV